MYERLVAVGSRVGLHARPAAIFTKAAAGRQVKVTIRRPDGDPVNARSMLSVLALGVRHGEEVVLAAEGDGAEQAVDELAEMLATDLDEEPAPGTAAEAGKAAAEAGEAASGAAAATGV
ncbi:HPr family phosphocarrier protein [Allostreptomyces psammosilenae]|uniref:Phosphocarrier protein HPr n=1 Tax=Allostreptomyces psammosilenae TaxID=1892865 RepID=A0A852ZWM0_9ACTN|nr:phosphocarrier protein [Allostreptomyces psammosilenae]